jgi:hypothetical protein
LKCLPVEAETVNGDRYRAVEHPTPIAVALGRDEPGPNPARLGPPLVDVLDRAELIRYEHIGHFGPLEDPWTVARDISRHIDRVS